MPFGSFIFALRWGYKNVNDYYQKDSTINKLLSKSLNKVPKTLILHSLDDPWVPATAAKLLNEKVVYDNSTSNLDIILTKNGGHNGFHGKYGCWGDLVVKDWLLKLAGSI